jgi:nucleoside phosphorylase
MAAAHAMLDKIHETLPMHADDSNAYILGNIKQHNIVVACLPEGRYGLNNAANVLTHLVRTFPSIRAGLMVGIGGGVPSKADIRLGDIVVGTRVVQYDLGKIVGDGQMQHTAIPKIPQQLLGTAVSSLRARHEREGSRIPYILREKFKEHSEYRRPASPDCLFLSTYDHVSQTSACDECDHSKLVRRRIRETDDPLIHYGTIASGNQVMRSGTQRDSIARQLDVICFEMEAAGLMDILPCLPIRGICDYSDSHKNKEWQRYAAAAAASYARELLTVLPVAEARVKATYMPNTRKLSLVVLRSCFDYRGSHPACRSRYMELVTVKSSLLVL